MGFFAKILGRAGALPPDVRARIVADGALAVEERVGGSVTYRNYRAPGRFSNLRKVGSVWAVALSSRQLLVMSNGRPMLDVPWSDDRIAALEVSIDKNGKLLIAFDPSVFDPLTSGRIEVRARIADPQRIVDLIQQRQRR